MEGAISFALSAAPYGEITIENGCVSQSNYDSYPLLRFGEAPVAEVHLVASNDPPSGIGELGVPPVAPAVANALFTAKVPQT